jgi:hypothetical protein
MMQGKNMLRILNAQFLANGDVVLPILLVHDEHLDHFISSLIFAVKVDSLP